jgi:anthranilate 1,2-dioxygenase small subunit
MSEEMLRQAAQDLIDDYAELIDADRLEEWLDLFTEDCVYRVMSRENVEQNLPVPFVLCTNKNMLRDRIVSLRKANKYNLHYDRHIVSNVRVRPMQNGVAALNASYAVYQTTLEGRSQLFSVGRYQDRVKWEGDRLKLMEKLVITDTFAVLSLLATPL